MTMSNSEVESCIRRKIQWSNLPSTVKQHLGDSQKEYARAIVSFSIKNQLRYRVNLVRQVMKDSEQKYYEELLSYSQASLLLYPYHLSDILVNGMRVTPFQYYCNVVESIMVAERSYDSLPNFTAADVLRLLGIGRNEYIDLMNQCRSRGSKLFGRRQLKDLLPVRPIDVHIEPWWLVQLGCIIQDDIKSVSQAEKEVIDYLIDKKTASQAGELDFNLVLALYKKGLIYLDVPIKESDHVVVLPLEGFVMNRLLGDYFETLLYKIFVSIDEHTSVGELASVLDIEPGLVKQAVSLYCRLGFARRKGVAGDVWHPTWTPAHQLTGQTSRAQSPSTQESSTPQSSSQSPSRPNRVAFIFDSTLTAFLMMGNLSPGLKSHAVTMFEVGKLTDESIDNFLSELEKVSCVGDDSEGEARRYFEHALVLRSTIITLRAAGGPESQLALDLVRCESLHSLDPATCSRLLSKNYQLVVSMAPLSAEVAPILCRKPPHLGPASPLVATPWWRLFIYSVAGNGPYSLFLPRGHRLSRLPARLIASSSLLMVPWGHDPTLLPPTGILQPLNDALAHYPVLVQVYDSGFSTSKADTCLVPFPFGERESEERWISHSGVAALIRQLELGHSCGYLTLLHGTETLTPAESRPIALHLRPDAPSHAVADTPTTPCLDAWIQTIAAGEVFSPVKEEDEEEPSNGITSQECQEMLQQEIDSLRHLEIDHVDSREEEEEEEEEEFYEDEGKLPGMGKSSLRSELSQSLHPELAPSLRNELAAEMGRSTRSWDPTEWTVLDCKFGVPLFDAAVNAHVCRAVTEKLAHPASLNKCVDASDRLVENLTAFIKSTQEWEDGEDLWWPVIPLESVAGFTRPWNGK